MGLMPAELLMVGDFRFDVIAGKRAGAATVLLNNDGRTVMAPGDPEPEYTISNLEEVVDIIEDFKG
jgi:phosphoglycolate phosphatase-like HAD superfamily hydrolase